MSLSNFLRYGINFENKQFAANFYTIDTISKSRKDEISKIWHKLYVQSLQASISGTALTFSATAPTFGVLGVAIAIAAIALSILGAIRAFEALKEYDLWNDSPDSYRALTRKSIICIEEMFRGVIGINIEITYKRKPDKATFLTKFFTPANPMMHIGKFSPQFAEVYRNLKNEYRQIKDETAAMATINSELTIFEKEEKALNDVYHKVEVFLLELRAALPNAKKILEAL